jgi:hypothetical protein
MLPARQFYVARGDIRKERTSFDYFPGKVETECGSNFENF